MQTKSYYLEIELKIPGLIVIDWIYRWLRAPSPSPAGVGILAGLVGWITRVRITAASVWIITATTGKKHEQHDMTK